MTQQADGIAIGDHVLHQGVRRRVVAITYSPQVGVAPKFWLVEGILRPQLTRNPGRGAVGKGTRDRASSA